MVEEGGRITAPKNLDKIAQYSQKRLSKLPNEFKRFENPHIYKVGLSTALKQERDQLVESLNAKIK